MSFSHASGRTGSGGSLRRDLVACVMVVVFCLPARAIDFASTLAKTSIYHVTVPTSISPEFSSMLLGADPRGVPSC